MISTLEMAPLDMLMSNCFIFSSARSVCIYILAEILYIQSNDNI